MTRVWDHGHFSFSLLSLHVFPLHPFDQINAVCMFFFSTKHVLDAQEISVNFVPVWQLWRIVTVMMPTVKTSVLILFTGKQFGLLAVGSN